MPEKVRINTGTSEEFLRDGAKDVKNERREKYASTGPLLESTRPRGSGNDPLPHGS